MRLARIVGTVVATRKNPKLEGAKLLLARPVDQAGEPTGAAQLARSRTDSPWREAPMAPARVPPIRPPYHVIPPRAKNSWEKG